MQGNGDRQDKNIPYKVSTNRAVERLHCALNAILGRVVSASQRDWDESIPNGDGCIQGQPPSSHWLIANFSDVRSEGTGPH